ncbi:hypothetical protein JKP88DRAFT_243531 [Tribonema minus]|uniref:Uncharacterized protein n=1 Tax=Tribonema minus TaxID=303371 RepID=A0A836CKA1_9STRA|nr:hypothetical protein JKP88DRAFT_243531 [Tribonema minus]
MPPPLTAALTAHSSSSMTPPGINGALTSNTTPWMCYTNHARNTVRCAIAAAVTAPGRQRQRNASACSSVQHLMHRPQPHNAKLNARGHISIFRVKFITPLQEDQHAAPKNLVSRHRSSAVQRL